MARIEINLPDEYLFSTNIPVRIMDVGGTHVNWAAMWRILDEASVQFWNGLDYPEIKDEKTSRITVDAGINYKKQAFHGQTLKVEIGATNFSSKGFDQIFRVTDLKTGDEIVTAKAGVLCFDYKTQAVCPVPAGLRAKLSS